MLTVAFQSMSYLIAALIFITLTHSLESSGIRTLESEYSKGDSQRANRCDDITPVERRTENMLDCLIRVSRGYGKPEHAFGRIVRNEPFQASPLIRFGKRYVMDDGRTEELSRLLRQYLQQQPYFDESNHSRR